MEALLQKSIKYSSKHNLTRCSEQLPKKIGRQKLLPASKLGAVREQRAATTARMILTWQVGAVASYFILRRIIFLCAFKKFFVVRNACAQLDDTDDDRKFMEAYRKKRMMEMKVRLKLTFCVQLSSHFLFCIARALFSSALVKS